MLMSEDGMRHRLSACIGSENFQRIKIGVGSKPHPDYDLADWVLGEIPKDKQETILSAIMNACDALSLMIDEKTDLAMSKFN